MYNGLTVLPVLRSPLVEGGNKRSESRKGYERNFKIESLRGDQMIQVLQEEIDKIRASLALRYESEYAAFSTPFDPECVTAVITMIERCKELRPTMFVLVGIGGSNMGTLAVLQALKGVYYNEKAAAPIFLCADTIDNDTNASLLAQVERELGNGGRVIVCIVTKSGTTTETLINGALLIELLKKHRPVDYKNYVMAITDQGSPLHAIAQKNNYMLLEIPKLVGGRFSVFSAVGLFPLGMMGIDILAFCEGAQEMLGASLETTNIVEPIDTAPMGAESIDTGSNHSEAGTQALVLYEQYQAGHIIHDFFVFSPDLFMLANWYKQLVGESLGKKYDLNGNVVEVGFTPTVSVGTVDLHSVVQLYLAGPRHTTTTFIYFDDEKSTLKVPSNELSAVVPGLAGRTVTEVKNAILRGVMQAYDDEKRPFMPQPLQKTSHSLGQFMMLKMLETVLLARLFNINPFDQPAVELYKQRAREFLGSKT